MSSQTVQIPNLYGRDFLAIKDFSGEELSALLDYADLLKREKRQGIPHPHLLGKSIAMYFEKPSNRTRVSFEVGIYDLGAHPIYLRKEEVNLGVRETIEDTARTLSRYVDGIMIRTFNHTDVEQLARYATVPVINGLTDYNHPCQVLADLQTMREKLGSLQGKKLAYVGDGNNMTHSLLSGCTKLGMDISIATPKGYEPHKEAVESAHGFAQKTGAKISITNSVTEAAEGANVLYTDVWASMGSEREIDERRLKFQGFQINPQLMSVAKPDAFVLHCLPAHRGEEIDAETFESNADVIFEEAENRLHAQKALMVALIKKPN